MRKDGKHHCLLLCLVVCVDILLWKLERRTTYPVRYAFLKMKISPIHDKVSPLKLLFSILVCFNRSHFSIMYIAKYVLTHAHESFYIIVMTAAHTLLISVLSMRTCAQDFKLFIVIKLKYIISTYSIHW